MSAKNYNLKEAYNKALTGKARLHYLENYEHDSRRGYAGEYSGNHPKYSKGVAMAGDPNSPMKVMDDDLKYMPIEDIAGQGTEGVNMKVNPIKFEGEDEKPPKGFEPTLDEVEVTGASNERMLANIESASKKNFLRQNVNTPSEITSFQSDRSSITPKNLRSLRASNPEAFKKLNQKTGGQASIYSRQGTSMMKSPMKEQKYGGNIGDESRSRRDFAGPSMKKSPIKEGHYGGNKGDESKSRRDFEGPSMMKSPMKSLKFGRR
jgi:hypothetical protein